MFLEDERSGDFILFYSRPLLQKYKPNEIKAWLKPIKYRFENLPISLLLWALPVFTLPRPCRREKASFDLGMLNGMVVAVPNPSPLSEGEDVDAAIRLALEEATRRGLKGRDVTPFLLARVNETTGGQSLQSNVALVRLVLKI